MLQPPWLSAHFIARPIFVSPSLPPKPARSARPFGPVRPTRASAPTSGFHRHRCPSGRAADCRPPPCVKSQTEAPSCRLHFPH
jgi:hypothetical protein